jgi:hypothetical protein
MKYGRGKSDSAIVAVKLVNEAGQPAAEPVERRAEAKGSADQQTSAQARLAVKKKTLQRLDIIGKRITGAHRQ